MALSNRYNFVLKDIQLATSIVVHMKYCIRHILRPKMLFNIFYLSIEYNISVIKLFSYRLFYISESKTSVLCEILIGLCIENGLSYLCHRL